MQVHSQEMQDQAEQAVAALEDLYSSYKQQYKQERQAEGFSFARLFRRWGSCDETKTEPVHQEFLTQVNRQVDALCSLLKENPSNGQAVAWRAVRCMILQESVGQKTDSDWYIIAAEIQAVPLLPYLSHEDLQNCRSFMLQRTPRKWMLPKQLELLDSIEKLL